MNMPPLQLCLVVSTQVKYLQVPDPAPSTDTAAEIGYLGDLTHALEEWKTSHVAETEVDLSCVGIRICIESTARCTSCTEGFQNSVTFVCRERQSTGGPGHETKGNQTSCKRHML